jgi:hypothetical protein
MLVHEICGVLEVIHITIYWRDARNAIVPAWHLGPHVFARRRAHFAYLTLGGVLNAGWSGDLFEHIFQGMIA